MQNSLLFAFVLLSRQRSWQQVTPGYFVNYLGGNFSMTCSCYSKPNFAILLGKVCWECPGVSKSCRFSCLFEWEAVLFCFMTFPIPAYCAGPASVRHRSSTAFLHPHLSQKRWIWPGCVYMQCQGLVKVHTDSCWIQNSSSVANWKPCFFSVHVNSHHEWFLSPETLSTHKGRALLRVYGPDVQLSTTEKKRNYDGVKMRAQSGG